MTRVPEIVLFDIESGIMASEDMLYGANAPILIDPFEAMTWIATGGFGDIVGPRRWTEFAEETLGSMVERSAGRSELAEEIVIDAIAVGRVRCVRVSEDAKKLPRLSYVDPATFVGKEISHEWSDGLTIQIFAQDDDDDYLNISGIWFFWEDIASLTPRRPSVGAEIAPLIPHALVPASVADRPHLITDARHPASIGKGQTQDRSSRRGRGRPAGKNGEPIAMFVLRAQSEGVEALAGLTDDALGAMLQEEYLRLGLNVPENTNAGRDARGVMQALVKMTVKLEPHEA